MIILNLVFIYLYLQISIILFIFKNIQEQNILMSDFIASERVLNYCINISEHYCSHWEPIHALRQALQNWQDIIRQKYQGKKVQIKSFHQENLGIYRFHPMIDGVKSEENYILYDKEDKALELVNQGSFKVQNMLMGASSKMNSTITLGQFGQGMKLYLLILLKHNHVVFIESGEYYYGPTLDKWVYKYDDRVLFVHISPRSVSKANTRVKIKQVDEILFKQFTYLSLSLVKNYKIIEYPKMRLIISDDEKLKNRIYKKGILVAMRFNVGSIYSYDLDEITLGRDRDSVNDPHQLKDLLSKLHAYILNDHDTLDQKPDIRDKLEQHQIQVIKGIKSCLFWVYHAHSFTNQQTCERIYRHFLLQNQKQELYPVNSSGDTTHINNQLKKYGLQQNFYPTIQTGCHYAANLRKFTGRYYQAINQKIAKQLTNERELNDGQKDELNPIINNVILVLPQANNFRYKVSGLKQAHCYRSADKSTIFINLDELKSNKDKFKRKLMKLILYDD